MSERKPLLSDKQIGAIAGNASVGWDCAAEVRDSYEDMIDEGKLLIVEEVTLVETDEGPNGKLERCSRCEGVVNPLHKWCPFCAGKIKR